MKFKGTDILGVFMIFVSYIPIEGARILAVLPMFTRSHHRFSQPLLKTLARAGHEVVVYSPFPLDNPIPNYTDIFMENVSTENENITYLALKITEYPHYMCMDLFKDLFEISFNDFIKSEKILKLLNSKESFDLVITEAFSGQEFTLILGHIFKSPVIVVQAFVTNCIINSISGNALSISHIPDTCSPFSNKMSFLERIYNTFYVWRNLYYVYYNEYLPMVEHTLRKHFPDSPPLIDLISIVSLNFVNDHLTADYSQTRTPNIVPVGGIHTEDEHPLPKPIQHFMDAGIDGVILFSLGTYVPDELQPKEYFEMYINVFRQLRQRVLWKTRKENIQGLPDNVMTVKWTPQRSVLAHPNCVLFITHGGMLSQHEAIHYEVPVVVIPQFWDQHRNGRFYEQQRIGVRLTNSDLTEQTVLSAVRNVLANPMYKTNIRRLSAVFRDRPLTPAQTVVFWTEYVLRHGASHLRPASTQLSWYQLALLDVLAVILAMIVFLALMFHIVFKKVYNYVITKRVHLHLLKKSN